MGILVVDDSSDHRLLLKAALQTSGYADVTVAGSALEAFELLGLNDPGASGADVELILMDIRMPDVDGIEACRRIKAYDHLRDVPILLVTGRDSDEVLAEAFAAGAVDFLTKPVGMVELLARVRSALALKAQMECCRKREVESLALARKLAEANAELERISRLDGLTGVSNRRAFDEALTVEWRRMMREGGWLSLVMVDIDQFKAYNDANGHVAGDGCLVRVADFLSTLLRRAGDLVARYGGEEFCILLPQTELEGALSIAEAARAGVEALGITHDGSADGPPVTVSAGVASIVPQQGASAVTLLETADGALYWAKEEGRNRVRKAGAGARPKRVAVQFTTLRGGAESNLCEETIRENSSQVPGR